MVEGNMAAGQNQWYHFGVGAAPILVEILVGIGMFTGGTIWILSHGHIDQPLRGRISPSLAGPEQAHQRGSAHERAGTAHPEAPKRAEVPPRNRGRSKPEPKPCDLKTRS